jgi:phosphate-selective porin
MQMQTKQQLPLALGLALGLQIPLTAGQEAAPVQAAPSNPGNWCDWLQNKPGTLYKNKENPYFQEFQLEGRFQYQAAYLDGSDVDGNDFNETYDEYRRFRLGAKGKFLQYFGFKFQANLVDDTRNVSGGGDLDWGYQDIDEAYLSFDLGKALGENVFDSLMLTYGRQKFLLSQESHVSSTKLLTVERSAIANKVYDSARPTGLSVDATKGDWRFNTSIYSSTTDGEDNEAFNGWQDSVIYYANAGYKVSDELSLGADFVYNAADAVSEDSVLPYDGPPRSTLNTMPALGASSAISSSATTAART